MKMMLLLRWSLLCAFNRCKRWLGVNHPTNLNRDRPPPWIDDTLLFLLTGSTRGAGAEEKGGGERGGGPAAAAAHKSRTDACVVVFVGLD